MADFRANRCTVLADGSCPNCGRASDAQAAAERAEIEAAPCPRCGHSNEEHRRESWYDEEGVEGMTCQACPDDGPDEPCKWWTHEWVDVIAGRAL